MKTIDMSQREIPIDALLQEAIHENLILLTDDGREFVLAEIDSFDREIELTRQNQEFMALLEERWKEKATIPIEEARRMLGIDNVEST
jgi:hypothetical protein